MDIVKLWNNVLRDIATSLSLETFQNKLDRLLSVAVISTPIPFQYRTELNSEWFLMYFQGLYLSFSHFQTSLEVLID